jgi:hypothetical protein
MMRLIERFQVSKSGLDRFGGKRTMMVMDAKSSSFGSIEKELIDVIVDDLADLVAVGWGANMTDICVEDIGGIDARFAGHGVEDGAGWAGEGDLTGDFVFAGGFADHPNGGGWVALFDPGRGHFRPVAFHSSPHRLTGYVRSGGMWAIHRQMAAPFICPAATFHSRGPP